MRENGGGRVGKGKKVGGRCVFGKVKGKERRKCIGEGMGLVYVGSHEPGGRELKKKRGEGRRGRG